MSELLNFQRSLELTGQIINLCAALMLLSLFIMEGDWSFLRRKKHT